MCFIIQANSFSWQLYHYYRLRSQSHRCPTVRSSSSLADHGRGIRKMLKCGFSVPKSQQEELMPCSTPHTLTEDQSLQDRTVVANPQAFASSYHVTKPSLFIQHCNTLSNHSSRYCRYTYFPNIYRLYAADNRQPPAFQSSAHRPSGAPKDILGIQTTSADLNSILPPQLV